MTQGPVLTKLTVVPDTVQIVGDAELKVTARWELAVAATGNVAAPIYWVGTVGKVMLCAVGGTTANDCVTCGAAP